MAGGRISGLYARAAGTSVKALVRVAGTPAVCAIAGALRQAQIQPVVAVGPQEVREALRGAAEWTMEAGSALENLEAGLEWLAAANDERVLLCGGDVPVLSP